MDSIDEEIMKDLKLDEVVEDDEPEKNVDFKDYT